MSEPRYRYLQLQATEYDFLRARVREVADEAFAFLRESWQSHDFPERFREVVAGLIGARVLAPTLNGLRIPGGGPPIVAELERRPFERAAGWFRGADGVDRFATIIEGEDTPDGRRRGLYSALLSEIGDMAGGGGAGEAAMATFHERPTPESLIACGLDEGQAARVVAILALDADQVTIAIVEELEELVILATRGYQILATPDGMAGLNATLRASARRTAARMLDASLASTVEERQFLASVASMTDPEMTGTVINRVHRIAAEVTA